LRGIKKVDVPGVAVWGSVVAARAVGVVEWLTREEDVWKGVVDRR